MGSGRAYLGVGSNVDPEKNVWALLELLTRNPSITLTGISTFFRTPALSLDSPEHPPDPDFLNGVLEVETPLEREELAVFLGGIETALGRVRGGSRYGARTMDVDILLHLPEEGPPAPAHPDVCSRAFVALPLLELAPDLVLPSSALPLKEIAARFPGAGGPPEREFTEALRGRFLRR